MKIKKIISLLILLLLFALIYSPLDALLKEEFEQTRIVKVERVIDGDTIELKGGEKVRLFGINTPEKGEKYYQEAKEFLEKEILNNTIKLKFGKEKKDRYNRTLAYIYLGNENINKKIISEGFANAYFPSGKDYYYSSFLSEWEKCVGKSINYCKKSGNICANCILLEELNPTQQKIILKNACGFECALNNWSIKDEGSKKFIFSEFVLEPSEKAVIIVGENEVEGTLLWKRKDYVWTKSGDTLFLRDEKNNLVLWKNY